MSEKYVVVGERLVPWPEVAAARRARADAKRSDLSAPMIICDSLDDIQNPCDGRRYDSKSAYYRAVKEAGCVIVGNEAERLAATSAAPPRPEVTRHEIAEAVQKVQAGYKPKIEFENYGTD